MVITPTGNWFGANKLTAVKSDRVSNIAPINAEAVSPTEPSLVNFLASCGATKAMNEIGPVAAVTAAVKMTPDSIIKKVSS